MTGGACVSQVFYAMNWCRNGAMPEFSSMARTAFVIVMAAAPLLAPDVIVNAPINGLNRIW